MGEKILNDRVAREKIVTKLGCNYMIEAGAGAGKTHILIERIIAQILSGTDISKIVAITFTNKATAELKERFKTKLEEKFLNESNAEKKDILEYALNNISSCFIGTIHSFCLDILRKNTIEASLNINFKHIEEAEEVSFKTMVWYEFLNKVSSSIEVRELIQSGVEIDNLKDTYLSIANKNYVSVNLVQENIDREIELFNEIKKIIKYAIDNLKVGSKDHTKASEIYQKISGEKVDSEKLELINYISGIKYFTSTKKDIKSQKIRFEEIQELFKNKVYIKSMEFIQEAVKYLNKRKIDEGLVGNDDLILYTRNLLRDKKSVREKLSKKYEFILIDEFQDTDPLQVQILFYIVSLNREEKDWRKLKLKNGSFMIVGDAKQSIYRFRNADISIYNEVRNIIKEKGGEILQLTTNFRSNKNLCYFYNKEFKGLFEESNHQVGYSEMDSYDDDNKNSIFNYTVSSEEDVAKYIKYTVDKNIKIDDKKLGQRNIKYSDYMILTKGKSEATKYKNILTNLGVPARGYGEFELAKNHIIVGFLNLLKYINDERDTLALMVALKNIFNISDNKIINMKLENYDLNKFLEYDFKDKELTSVKKYIKECIDIKNNNISLKLVDKIINDISRLMPKFLSDESKVEELYYLAEKLRANISIKDNISKVVKKAEVIINNNDISDVVSLRPYNDFVRVMNIHKAKGLEAEIVIIIDKSDKVKPKVQHIYLASKGDLKGDFCIYKSGFNGNKSIYYKPLKWSGSEKIENEFDISEKIRLEYVAGTRAKNKLLLITKDKEKTNSWIKNLLSSSEIVDLNNELESYVDYKSNLTKVNNDELKVCINIDRTIKLIAKNKLETEKVFPLEENIFDDSFKKETYQITFPTKDKYILDNLELELSGGKVWGNIVHKTFEQIVKSKLYKEANIKDKCEKIVENSLALSDRTRIYDDDKKTLYDIIDKFEKSEVVRLLNKSSSVYSEVKFGFENKEKEYIKGIIDLLIKVNDTFIIIDYKSDKVKSINDANKRTEIYKSQILDYKAAIKSLFKTCNIESKIYFSNINFLIDIK